MAAVRITVQALLRAGAVALLLVAYDYLYDQAIPPTRGDADIGKGLLAFLLVAGMCFMWGLFDGLRRRPLGWAVAWIVAGALVGVGWELVITDGSFADIELGGVIFTAQLVLVPAIFGAGLAWALGGRNREAQPAH